MLKKRLFMIKKIFPSHIFKIEIHINWSKTFCMIFENRKKLYPDEIKVVDEGM